MKYLSIILLLGCLVSCQGLKNIEEQPQCPKDFECYTEIKDNKEINVLEDTIGQSYLRLEDAENSMVVKYIYDYKRDPRIMDDGYREIIYFQIPKDTKTLELENSEMSNIKLYIQKSCFCPDGGYEQILNGKFKLKKYQNSLVFDLEFEVQKDVKLNLIQTKVEL